MAGRGAMFEMAVAMVVSAVVAAGCSDGGNSVAPLPSESDALPSAQSTTSESVVVSATGPPATSPATTEAADVDSTPATETVSATDPSDSVTLTSETSVPATVPPSTVIPGGVVGLSADGPWRLVDSAPGVNSPGLVYELMPKLWVFLPTEESKDDGTLFVPSPNDIPIIEAYLQAELVYFRSVTTDPIDLSDPGWQTHFGDKGQSYFAVLEKRRDGGQVADLEVGVVLRPRVIGDGRTDTSAVIFDCGLDGGVFRMPDGSLAPGSIPGVVRSGTAAPVDLGATGWIVRYVVNQVDACQ